MVPGTCIPGYLCLLGGGVVAGGVDAGQGTLLELHEGQPTSPQPHIERERHGKREGLRLGVVGKNKGHRKRAIENHG